MLKVNQDALKRKFVDSDVKDIKPGTVFRGTVYTRDGRSFDKGIWMRLNIAKATRGSGCPDVPLLVRLTPVHMDDSKDLFTTEAGESVLNFEELDATIYVKAAQ